MMHLLSEKIYNNVAIIKMFYLKSLPYAQIVKDTGTYKMQQ